VSATTTAIDRTGCRAGDPDNPKLHGTYSTYKRLGCQCPDAREAARLYVKRRKQGRQPRRRIDNTGTIRRLRALAALGYSTRQLAVELGISYEMVELLRRRRGGLITRDHAARVARVYNRLSGTPGGDETARKRAAFRRWPTPMAWEGIDIDDPAAVPDIGAQPRRYGGFVKLDVEDLAVTLQRGATIEEIARSTGRKVTTIQDLLRDAGTTDDAPAEEAETAA
jgi:hypothetical protein